jgi:hypothetical protein
MDQPRTHLHAMSRGSGRDGASRAGDCLPIRNAPTEHAPASLPGLGRRSVPFSPAKGEELAISITFYTSPRGGAIKSLPVCRYDGPCRLFNKARPFRTPYT